MAKILLIGGSGFLSGTMATCALRDGHEVWAVTRGKRSPATGVQAIVADRKDRDAFAQAIREQKQSWDLAIDCIGFDAEDAGQDVEVISPLVQHLVFISTDFVLSPVDRPWKVDETYDKWNDTAYGVGKRAAEELLLSQIEPVTILRPCHIYGPGSLLGCLAKHGRDPQLIERMKHGETLQLVGGGHFLQQPVFAPDLWRMALSCLGNARASRQIYFAPGQEIIESREFYRLIGEFIGVPVTIEEVPIKSYLREHPEHGSFFAHRVYDTAKAQRDGLHIPSTPLREGLRLHVESILNA